MTFPRVDPNDKRNWTAPNLQGALGGPQWYEGRGAMPDTPTPPRDLAKWLSVKKSKDYFPQVGQRSSSFPSLGYLQSRTRMESQRPKQITTFSQVDYATQYYPDLAYIPALCNPIDVSIT